MGTQDVNNSNTKSYRVLIIEDEEFVLNLIMHKFKDQNWEVSSAMNGETGLEKARQKPDIILLDILLPGINGYEVLQTLKSDEELKYIPILVLSNYGQKDEVERSKELGAVDHLVKANIIIEEVIDRAERIIAGTPNTASADE